MIGADTTTDQRTALLSRFCPETVVRPGYKPDDGEVDLLLSNDVLSEGQNLQQAGAVVSYDMPWNPQRMVQRYGRVIRLKSPHDEVHLTTMLPEAGDLEEILKLEIAIRRKIVAARPYGMEVEVVDNMEQEARAYARRVVDGDETLLDEDDEPGGTHGFSGEALRADLRRELEEGRGDELRNLPWGIGAAFRQGPDSPSSGPPGVFFACRAKGERYWRYVDADGVVREPATILRRIDPGYAPGVDDPPIDLEAAWSKAVESILEEHNEEALAPKSESLGPKQRWALELLADPTIAVPVGGGEAYEALRVGRSQPVRRALGEVKRLLDGEEITRAGAAKRIVDIVKMFGLRKVETAPGEGGDCGGGRGGGVLDGGGGGKGGGCRSLMWRRLAPASGATYPRSPSLELAGEWRFPDGRDTQAERSRVATADGQRSGRCRPAPGVGRGIELLPPG